MQPFGDDASAVLAFQLEIDESCEHMVIAKGILDQLIELNDTDEEDKDMKVIKKTAAYLQQALDSIDTITREENNEQQSNGV